MRALILTILLVACAPTILAPAPTPAAKGPTPSDDVMIFAEELITRRAFAAPCVGYYDLPVRVRVSNTGEILGICGTL